MSISEAYFVVKNESHRDPGAAPFAGFANGDSVTASVEFLAFIRSAQNGTRENVTQHSTLSVQLNRQQTANGKHISGSGKWKVGPRVR